MKTLLLCCLSFVVGLLLCEGMVRLVVPQRLDSILASAEPDDDLVFKLKKNMRATYSQAEFAVVEETNSLGLRDHEVGPKRPGTSRLLGLGDSFSFANGVPLDDIYFKRLERALTAAHGRPMEIINCAVPAYSLLQEVRFLKKYGLALEPDGVIVGFYVGNDFTDSYDLFDEDGTPTIAVRDGILVSRKLIDQQSGLRGATYHLRRSLATHSHLYILFRNRFSEVFVRLGLRVPPPPPLFCAKQFSPYAQQGWELDQRLLLELADLVRQRGMRLVVVVLPTIYQVYEEAWNRHAEVFKVDADQYDLKKPQKLLMEFCAQQQIECVDVLPYLRRVGKTQQLYFPIDAHMNPEGQRAVADTLFQYFTTASLAYDTSTTFQTACP